MKAKKLSASRIKTLEICSWSYWSNYHTDVPQIPNDGALRGTISHLVLEVLLNKKHKSHFDKIIEAHSIDASPPISRLVKKHIKKSEILSKNAEENYELIDEFLLVGLNHDFFGNENEEVDEPEKKFDITNAKPKYHILGFIDKIVRNRKDKTLTIVDYKTSKYKFRGEELSSNVQAMMYTLAAKSLWPEYKSVIKFLFLRHGKSPVQQLEFNDEEMNGFEYYLEHMYKIINNFDESVAKTNYAADNKKNKWMCGIGSWRCPYRDPREYFVLFDENKKILKTSHRDNLVAEKGQTIGTQKYEGCPRFNYNKQASQQEDPFDLSSESDDPFNF